MNDVNQIPLLRFSEFNIEWKNSRLGKLGEFKGGGTPSTNNLDYWRGNIPWVSSSDIEEENVIDINVSRFLTKKAIEESATKIIPKGSILFVSRVGVGKLAVTKEEICTSQDFANLTLVEDDSYFIAYYFLSKNKLLHQYAQGTSIKGFTTGDLKSIPIKIPSVIEQQKIASFLYSVDKKIESLQKKKALLEEYKKGVMQKIFSQELRFKDDEGNEYPDWEEKTLKTLLKNYRLGGNYSNSDKITGKPLIKMGNLARGNIKIDKIQYIDDVEEVDSIDRIKEGDLFFNTRNTLELVGKVAIWKNELPLAYYNSNLMKMDFDNNYFMNYRLNSFEGIKGLKRYATGTTSVAAIYTKDLLKLKLNIPSLEEQTKIADFLSAIDNKIQKVNTQIENTKEFKKGLLQQMFV